MTKKGWVWGGCKCLGGMSLIVCGENVLGVNVQVGKCPRGKFPGGKTGG